LNMNPFLLLGIALVLLAIFYFLFRRPNAVAPNSKDQEGDEPEMIIFDPEEDAVKLLSRRKVTIAAPSQTIGGVKRQLLVEANTLPNLPDLQVLKVKGIDKLIVLV